MKPYAAVLSAPTFSIGIECNADDITGIDYLELQSEVAPATPLAQEAVRQLRAWLKDPRFEFGLPLAPLQAAGCVAGVSLRGASQMQASGGRVASPGAARGMLRQAPRVGGRTPDNRQAVALEQTAQGSSGGRRARGAAPDARRGVLDAHTEIGWSPDSDPADRVSAMTVERARQPARRERQPARRERGCAAAR